MTVFTKRRLATAAAFAAGVALGAPLAWGFIPNTQDATGIFELDGDAFQESSPGNPPPPFGADDFSNILSLLGSGVVPDAGKSTVDPAIASLAQTTQCVGITCNSANYPGVLFRGVSNTIFTGGSTKDPIDLTSWLWKTGNVQPKDNIQDAYAAAYVLNENIPGSSFNQAGDVMFVFGLDRISNNGDAFLGFWFFQSTVDTNGPAGSGQTRHFGNGSGGTASHTVGDILVLMNFPQGSPSSPTVGVLEWVTMCTPSAIPPIVICASPNLKFLIPLSTDLCNATDQEACGITNLAPSPSPWPFQSVVTKTPANTFPPQSFYEGAINLSQVFRHYVGTPIGCLSSFLAETRASESASSTLSAFVLGKFALCGMSASKTCGKGTVDNTTNTVDYPYTFEVKNTGIGTLYNVVAVDDSGTPMITSDDQTFNIGMLAKKGNTGDTFDSGPQSFPSTNLAGPTNTLTVTANTQQNGQGTTITATAQQTCTPPTINPTLQVTKICSGPDPYSGGGRTPLGNDPTGVSQPLGAYLAVVNGQIQVRVKVDIHVCNTDPTAVNLNMVTVTDQPLKMDQTTPDGSPISVFTGGTTGGGVLNAGVCKDYMDDYAPSGATITAGEHGDSVHFFDKADATANAIVGGGGTMETETAGSNQANCPLCIP